MQLELRMLFLYFCDVGEQPAEYFELTLCHQILACFAVKPCADTRPQSVPHNLVTAFLQHTFLIESDNEKTFARQYLGQFLLMHPFPVPWFPSLLYYMIPVWPILFPEYRNRLLSLYYKRIRHLLSRIGESG